jgi:hypothetical protein
LDYEITKFEAKPHSLGHEIDISWEFNTVLPITYKFYLFKRAGVEITDVIVKDYLKNPGKESKPQDVFVFFNIPNDFHTQADIMVELKKKYYYKGVIVNINDVKEQSAIAEASATNEGFDAQINIVATKELVIEACEKIVESIGKVGDAKLRVHREFPLETPEGAFITVTRATNETAYRVFADILTEFDSTLIKGRFDSDVIQVMWWAMRSPSIRDKFTDIFRGAERIIKRYLMYNGVHSVDCTILADGFEEYKGQYIPYSGMLVRCLIENRIITEGEEVIDKLAYSLGFNSSDFVNQI